MNRRWQWLLLIAVPALAAPALAANREDAALDNSAALSGGVVVATIRSGGAIWYNPAGLGGNARGKLDVSLNAFVLRERSARGAIEGRIAEDLEASSDASSLELSTVPSSLVFSRRISDDVTIGLGVFVPRQDVYRVAVSTPIEEPPVRYVQRSEFTAIAQRYHVGPAVGWAVSPRLRLGLALFGIYESESLSARLWSRISIDGEEAPLSSLLILADESISRFGVQPTLGAQWSPTDAVQLGLTVRAPIVRVKGTAEGAALVQFAATGEDPVSDYDPDTFDDEPFGLMAPPSVHGGLALALDGGGFVGVAAEYRTALDDPAAEKRYAAVWNVQIGGLMPLSETLAVGVGLFTDHSDVAELDGLGDDRVDFYGITGGVRLRDPLTLEGGGELVFETTIGARYAVGVGQAGGLGLDYLSDDLITTFEVDVVHHTAALHIGSALLF